jgi:hypothetical protein
MPLVKVATALIVLSLLPLLFVGLLDPTANPVGLGLLWVAGSALGIGLYFLAVLLWIWRLLR